MSRCFFTLITLFWWTVPALAEAFLCAGSLSAESPLPAGVAAKSARIAASATGTRQALVLFARFRDEGSATVPSWAAQVFDASRPGSFSHYWDTMSFGRLRVRGGVAPRVYLSRQEVGAYLGDDSTHVGQFGRFSLEVLQQADADVDFRQFDNDGPDGVPDSGDDDGAVDAVFLVIASAPRDFLVGGATGIAGLGLQLGLGDAVVADPDSPGQRCFRTADVGAGGEPLRVVSDWGTVQQAQTLSAAVGAMCHEYGHVLGLPDLYNVDFLGQPGALPAEDSAGVGAWCLMGWGASGWEPGDGPTSLCEIGRAHV
jgi:M6 family metalloprotease-like protein